MNTSINDNSAFSPIVGEHYEYYGHAYEVMEIVADRYQLRSLERASTITYQSFSRLKNAWKKGRFTRIQEAPLHGEPNKILANLTQSERNILWRRQEYVLAIIVELNGPHPIRRAKEIIAITAVKINDLSPPCYNTAHNWIKAYFRSNGNPISLVTRSIRRKTPRLLRQPFPIQEIIQHHFKEYFLIRTPFSGTDVIDQIQAAVAATNARRPVNDPLPTPSASTLRRILNEHDGYERLLAQRGHKEAGKAHHWGKKNPKHLALLECAECDSHKLDIVVVDANGEPIGRPWITCLINVASRRVLGWKFSMNPPTLEMTISALKYSLSSSLLRTGLCRIYIFDNGPEFVKEILKIILSTLGSTAIFCEPQEPNQKPHIERFLKTLEIQLIHHMRGTTFSNPAEKGDYDAKKQAIYTLDQLESCFHDWIENVYHQAYHREIGTSPNTYWDEHIDKLFPPRQFSETALTQMFLCKESSLAINGRVGFNKLQWTCPSVPFLNKWRGQRKELTIFYDVSDLSYALVCHPDNPDDLHRAFAVDPEYQEGLTLSEHLKVLAELKQKKLRFNHTIALQHRLRINQGIARKNKRKSPKNKNVPQHDPRQDRFCKSNDNGKTYDPLNWVAPEDLPALTETCSIPPVERNDS